MPLVFHVFIAVAIMVYLVAVVVMVCGCHGIGALHCYSCYLPGIRIVTVVVFASLSFLTLFLSMMFLYVILLYCGMLMASALCHFIGNTR